MKLRQLRCFVVLAQELNFTRAASMCNLGQPGLSKLVAALEHDLGVTLLERDTKCVRLTPAGEAFLVTARAALYQLDRGVQQLRQTARQVELRVAFDAFMYGTPLPKVLRQFRQVRPDTTLVPHELTATVVQHALTGGVADVGVLIGPDEPSGTAFEPLADEGLSVVLPEGHRLTSRQTVTLDDLHGEPQLTYDFVLRSVLADLPIVACDRSGTGASFTTAGAALQPCSARGAWERVATDLGAHVTFAAYQQLFTLPPGVTVRPLADRTVPLFVAWREFSVDVRAFTRMLRDQFGPRGLTGAPRTAPAGQAHTEAFTYRHAPQPDASYLNV